MCKKIYFCLGLDIRVPEAVEAHLAQLIPLLHRFQKEMQLLNKLKEEWGV